MPFQEAIRRRVRSAAGAIVHLLRPVWRRHCRMIESSLLYRSLMVLLADTVIAQIDLQRLLQVLLDLLINLWAGHRPAY